jgi:geranylgeranyl pyrophosphate synthase
LERAFAPVRRELREVTMRLRAQFDDPVTRRVVYLISAGGKRLRPALVLLTGSVGTVADREAWLDTAMAVEMLHTATLIHDDIIDQSPLRRAQPTFHQRWGLERAVLMGDILYAQAFRVLAGLKTPSIMQIMTHVCRQLCRGELLEVEARYRVNLTEREYFAIIQEKTASLIGGCCHTGALLGGASPEQAQRLTKFGTLFGLGFQVMDDCLDLIGQAAWLGKATFTDLDKGVLSLPIIYLTQRLSAGQRARLFAPLRRAQALARRRPGRTGRAGRAAPRWLESGGAQAPSVSSCDPAFLPRVAQAAMETGAIADAQRRARALIQESQQWLKGVSLNGLAEAYRSLADYAMIRRS